MFDLVVARPETELNNDASCCGDRRSQPGNRTGLIGSKVVEKLKQKGHEAVATAPNTGVNTITGKGLKEAMAAHWW